MDKVKINFTPSQDIGVNKISEWLKKPINNDINSRVFLLMGQAGTGKTTIIKYALKKLIKEDIENVDPDSLGLDMFSIPNVLGVAMSHKAKNVLTKSIPMCRTYASYFGLKMKYNQDGTIEFVKEFKREYDVAPCELPIKVVVHDECSMYDQKMLDRTLKETNSSTKIIFMGDPGQLPPVNSDGADLDSPVFRLNLDEINSHTLTERVRQTDGNPIIALSDVIYDEIFGSQNIFRVLDAFKNTTINNNIGFETIAYRDFLDQYKEETENYMNTKVIAYKNVQVDSFNSSIRNFIHNKPDKIFIPNEIIYMNDSYMHVPKGERNKGKRKWICYNSDEYLITEIAEKTIDDVHCYILFIDKKGHKHFEEIDNPYVRVVSEKGMKKYNEIKFWRAKNAKEERDPKQRSKRWAFYYEFINQFGNTSYGYCFTGYKAQGSTYKHVYVDVNDILTTKPISNKRKLQALYTATTRASHKVTFLKAK